MSHPSGGESQYPGGSREAPQDRHLSAGGPDYLPRKHAEWPWMLGAIVLASIFLLGVFFTVVAVFGNEVDEELGSEVTVRYRVEGTGAEALIVYLGRDLDMAAEVGAAVPWVKDVTINGGDQIVSLTATNGAGGGDITCRILVDDRVLAEQTSTGPHASANCSGAAATE